MDFGIFMQFERRDGDNQGDAFKEGFALVDAAEEWGIDEAWLSEVHFAPTRTVLSSPAVIAGSIATRTERLRVGTAVSVLPLGNPLRIAEEMATVDQIAEGRFDFGIGRSAFPRAYDVYGIPYEESRGRFEEALEIILEAWKGDAFSLPRRILPDRQRPHLPHPLHPSPPATAGCRHHRGNLPPHGSAGYAHLCGPAGHGPG